MTAPGKERCHTCQRPKATRDEAYRGNRLDLCGLDYVSDGSCEPPMGWRMFEAHMTITLEEKEAAIIVKDLALDVGIEALERARLPEFPMEHAVTPMALIREHNRILTTALAKLRAARGEK